MVIAMLVLVLLVPRAYASFTTLPTFDLTTSSNLVGATDAIYSLFLSNPDVSEDAINVSIVIPEGYSIDQQFITSKAGVQAGSVSGACGSGPGTGDVMTTTTPGQFSISVVSGEYDFIIGKITVIQPTMASRGQIAVSFSGRYALVNHGCHASIEMGKGFFINPSAPGTYAWTPSSVNPTSGSPVTMAPRPGFSQSVTIVGSVTTTTTSSTNIPEFSSVLSVFSVLTLSVAMVNKRSIGSPKSARAG